MHAVIDRQRNHGIHFRYLSREGNDVIRAACQYSPQFETIDKQ